MHDGAALDFIGYPVLDRLAFQDNLGQRVDRPDVAAPQHGNAQRAKHRSQQGPAVATGHPKHTAEFFIAD